MTWLWLFLGLFLGLLSGYLLAKRRQAPAGSAPDLAADIERLHADSFQASPLETPPNPSKRLQEIASHLHQLQDRLNHADAVFQALDDGILIVGSTGIIEEINPALLGLLHIPGDSHAWQGRALVELVRDTEIHRAVEEVRLGHEIQLTRSVEHNRKFLKVTIRALSTGQHKPASSVCAIWRNVTPEVLARRAGKDLVANVAHELRTPLTSIKGYSETLLDGALEDAAISKEFVQIILKNADRLAHLVSDILTLARMDEEGQPAGSVVDLREILGQTLDTLAYVARDREVRLTTDIPHEPVMVLGRKADLGLALFNLIENAIKYTAPKTSVDIRMKTEGRQAIFSVSDHGPGIPQEALERIFERFFRLDKDQSRQKGGTGLGLAIVKQVAEAHQGRAWVESQWSKGATFFLALPLSPFKASSDKSPAN